MTRISWWRQLALAAALFALGSAAYWLEYKHKPEKEAREEQAKKIFSLKDTSVRSVRLENSEKVFELICSDLPAKLCRSGDNSKWELSSPLKLKADDSNANSLISALNNLNVTETIKLNEESQQKRAGLLKEYGLDTEARGAKDTRRLHVATESSGDTILYLGTAHPIGESVYAVAERVPAGGKPSGNVDENTVYLIPSYFKSNFEHDLTYWRDKKLMALSAHEISSFELSGAKGKVSANRKDGQWLLQERSGKVEEFAGDVENIDSLLSAAVHLTAKDFTSNNKSDEAAAAALSGAKNVITLSLGKEKGAPENKNDKEPPTPVTLTLFEKAKQDGPDGKNDSKKGKRAKGKTVLFAKVSDKDSLFELDASAKERFDKTIKDLRQSKLITSMERFTAKRLEFAGKPLGGQPLVLASADGKWTLQPEKSESDGEKINALLDKLSGNRIKDFLQGSAVPTGEQDGIKFTLGDDKTQAKRQILFWKNSEKLYARDLNSSRKEAFLLESLVKDSLPWDRSFFNKTAGTKASK